MLGVPCQIDGVQVILVLGEEHGLLLSQTVKSLDDDEYRIALRAELGMYTLYVNHNATPLPPRLTVGEAREVYYRTVEAYCCLRRLPRE